MKYYSEDMEEFCYDKSHFKKGEVVYKAKTYRDGVHFFCNYYNSIGEIGDCGRLCKKYAPRNNKSGICTHHGFAYEKTNIKIII